MAGDTKLFQESLKRGSAHAWNEQWDKAAEEYRRALREFPEDTSARTYLAMALYKSGSHHESLELYKSLWNAQPSNLTMLHRVAELQEAVGDREAASQSFGRLAEAHARRRAHKDAFKAFQKVVELSSANLLMWNSLVQMAIQAGCVQEVIPGYLGFARELALQSRFQDAIQIAERAQTLDPESPLVVPMVAAFRKGIEYSLRAASFGEEVYPEDLMRYIPSVEVLQSRLGPGDSGPAQIVLDTTPVSLSHGLSGQQVVRAVADGRNVVEIRLATTPQLLEQGLSANSVRNSLGSLGEVVRVGPEVSPSGGVVFVIVLSTAAGVADVQRSVQQLWQAPGSAVDVRPATQGEPAPALEAAAPPAPGVMAPLAPEEVAPPEPEALPEPEPEPVAEAEPAPEPEPAAEPEPEPALEPIVDEAPVAEEEPVAEELPAPAEIEHLAPPGAELELFPPDEEPPEAVEDEASAVPSLEVESSGEPPAVEEPKLELAAEEAAEEPAEDDSLLPVPDITWEEFEALTSESPTEDTEAAGEEPGLEELDAVELGADAPSLNGMAADGLEDLEPIEVPGELEEALTRLEMESAQGETEAAVEEIAQLQADVETPSSWEEMPAEEPSPAVEKASAQSPTWEELMLEVEAARSLGDLDRAVEIYERAMAIGSPSEHQYVELGELYEQMGSRERAAQAFGKALSLSPNLPHAMLGLARIDVFNHKLDAAEKAARGALEAATAGYPEAEAWAVDLLLDIVRERAAFGDLGGAAASLAWLRTSSDPDRLPRPIAEQIAAAPQDLLGRFVAENLEEIAAAPKHVRGEVASTLWKAEKLMEEGKLRSAADDMYRLISSHPDLLAAQSVLGRILVAQGRRQEASERARRLIGIYESRGKESGAVDVLMWMSEAGLATSDDQRRLTTLLRLYGRAAEADRMEEELAAAERAEAERRAAEEEAARRAAEAARRAAEEAARLAAEEAIRKAAEEAARRAAAEEAVRKTVEDLAKKAAAEELATSEQHPHYPEHYSTEPAAREDAQPPEPEAEAQHPEVLEPVEEPKPRTEAKAKRGLFGMFKGLRGGKDKAAEEKGSDQAQPGIEITSDVMARDALLRLAESKFAFGDAKGAAGFVRSALRDERISADLATRVALLRVLQVTSPSEEGLHEALVEILGTLGLPEDLVN